jgi:hypothetical protein
MWRSFFLAVGVTLCILGVQCLAIDKAVLAARPAAQGMSNAIASREISPADWAPWSLLSAGAVTMLYSFTVPNRVKN